LVLKVNPSYKIELIQTRVKRTGSNDAVYLALAERAKTDFYTADQRLFNCCQEIGISFVKQIV
jgi:predicted nucleic acid-binding protein